MYRCVFSKSCESSFQANLITSFTNITNHKLCKIFSLVWYVNRETSRNMLLRTVFLVSLVLVQVVFGQDHVVHFNDNTLHEGHRCENPTGESGVCVTLKQCQEPEREAMKRKICGYKGLEAIICCTKVDKFEPNLSDKTSGIDRTDEDAVALGNASCKYYSENAQINDNDIQWGDANVVLPSTSLVSIGWVDWLNYIEWKCTGSLIENFYVLLPAHCVSDKGNMPIVARVGDFRQHIKFEALRPIYFNISEVHIHPNYNPANFYHDLAILKLNPWTNITFSPKPVCLWSRNDIPQGEELVAHAYEETAKNDNYPNEPRQAFVDVINHQACQQEYSNDPKVPQGLNNNFICVIEEQNLNTLCTTVYGGELMLTTSGTPRDKRNFLVGISTFGQLCNKSPRVYTKVAPYMNWISSIVWP